MERMKKKKKKKKKKEKKERPVIASTLAYSTVAARKKNGGKEEMTNAFLGFRYYFCVDIFLCQNTLPAGSSRSLTREGMCVRIMRKKASRNAQIRKMPLTHLLASFARAHVACCLLRQ